MPDEQQNTFATPADLSARMLREFTEDETAWITTLLEDATEYLRAAIGFHLFPRRTVTFHARPDAGGEVRLPQHPVVSVDSVEADGVPVSYIRHDTSIEVSQPVDVTFTYGYSEVPPELRRWTCVLVSQAIFPVERGLGLKIGGLSSIQLDDFRIAFANAGDETGMDLSVRALRRLRQQFHAPHVFVQETR